MPMTETNERNSGKPLVLIFAVVLLLSLWITTRGWQASILDRHEFRQLQTALSTHWIKVAGYQLDYETPLFGPPWSIPFEFPVYQWCVAAVSQLLGTELEPTARGVSLGFFFAGLPAVYGLAGLLGLTPTRRLLVLCAVLTSPTYLFYARSFMIETTALCAAVWFLYSVTRAVREDRASWASLALACAVLASLAKVTTFVVFLPPAAGLTWLGWRHRWADRRQQPRQFWRATLFALGPVVVSAVLAGWWVSHSDALKNTNPFAGFLKSTELVSWNWGTIGQRFSGEFWRGHWSNISGLALGATPLAVLLLGASLVEPLYRRTAALSAIFFLGAVMIFPNLYYRHDYYYCANAVFLLIGVGFILAGIWDSPRLPTTAKWLVLALVLGGQLALYDQGYGDYQRRERREPPALARILRTVVPADKIVVIYGWDWNALLPYYAERRAIMIPRGREPETAVLDDILRPLPAEQIAALIIRPDEKSPVSAEFIRERLNRFKLAPAPFASSTDGDLYLPEEIIPEAAQKIKGQLFSGVTLNSAPTRAPDASQLHETDLRTLKLPAPFPRLVAARSTLGITLGGEAGRAVILAHPVSELHFSPPPGATRLEAEVGIADGAYAATNAAPTDGISVEIFEIRPSGLQRTLFRRDLDPAKVASDRGPQAISLPPSRPFTGTIVFRITPGPNNNPNSDWAYWSRIELR